MFKRYAATFVLGLSLAGCSGGTTGPSDDSSSSTCEGGKCDAFAPRALTSISTAFGQCTLTPDLGAADEFFAVEKVDCMFIDFEESAGAKIDSVIVEGRETSTDRYHSARFEAAELDGTPKTAIAFHTNGYPLEIITRPVVKVTETSSQLSEPRQSTSYMMPKITSSVDTRPSGPVTLDFELPVELWEVGVWPTKEFAEKLANEEVRFGYLTMSSEYEVEGQTERTSHSRIFRPADDLSLLSNTVFVLPKGDATPIMELRVDSNDPTSTVGIEAPGYFLIEADGTLTPATPQDIEARGMFADDAEQPVVVDNPDGDEEPPVTDPVDPPADMDPCNGSCDATEACVAAACVPLADQRQTSCSSSPRAACEEDADCASNNVCSGGLCRLRECQTQPSSCNTPRAVCDADSDCADDHACADGLCRRLTCQTQPSSCNTPHAVCEQSTDCATDHACVEGVCRRLSCQTQPSSCNTARQPCAADDSCASDHACVEGVCRRLSCQTQPSSCNTARQPCAADDDCASGHTCLDAVCQRLTCVD